MEVTVLKDSEDESVAIEEAPISAVSVDVMVEDTLEEARILLDMKTYDEVSAELSVGKSRQFPFVGYEKTKNVSNKNKYRGPVCLTMNSYAHGIKSKLHTTT